VIDNGVVESCAWFVASVSILAVVWTYYRIAKKLALDQRYGFAVEDGQALTLISLIVCSVVSLIVIPMGAAGSRDIVYLFSNAESRDPVRIVTVSKGSEPVVSATHTVVPSPSPTPVKEAEKKAELTETPKKASRVDTMSSSKPESQDQRVKGSYRPSYVEEDGGCRNGWYRHNKEIWCYED
jgi:hypothetical protein